MTEILEIFNKKTKCILYLRRQTSYFHYHPYLPVAKAYCWNVRVIYRVNVHDVHHVLRKLQFMSTTNYFLEKNQIYSYHKAKPIPLN